MNLKAMIEKRNALVEQVNELFKQAETETRALSEEENAKYDELTAEIRALDSTMDKMKSDEFRSMDVPKDKKEHVDKKAEEIRFFETYLREERAAGNMTKSSNGAVIPTTIANQILDKVKQIAPLYALATKFQVKGKLQFPVAKESIATAYANEFTALASSNVGFESRTLDGYLIGALSKVSVSLINNSKFDIVSYVVNKVAQSIAEFLEAELIEGAGGSTAIEGICVNTGLVAEVKTANSSTEIALSDLVTAMAKIPTQYQAPCRWLMNTNTLVKLRNLLLETTDYLKNEKVDNGFGFTLFGKQVMVSDTMKDDVIVYGDFSAVYVNVHEESSIQVLREKYADEHAVGVVAWLEVDGKVMEDQKLVKITKGE